MAEGVEAQTNRPPRSLYAETAGCGRDPAASRRPEDELDMPVKSALEPIRPRRFWPIGVTARLAYDRHMRAIGYKNPRTNAVPRRVARDLGLAFSVINLLERAAREGYATQAEIAPMSRISGLKRAGVRSIHSEVNTI